MKAEPPSDKAAVPVRTTSSTWRSAAVNPDTEAVASVRKDIDGQEARDRDMFAVCCLLPRQREGERERERETGEGDGDWREQFVESIFGIFYLNNYFIT
jgi:hypothetical protein